jgi:hypothetical protein
VMWTVRRSKSQPFVVRTGLLSVNVAAVLYQVLLAAQLGTHSFHVSTPVASAAVWLHLDHTKSLPTSLPSAHVRTSDRGRTWLWPSPQSNTAGPACVPVVKTSSAGSAAVHLPGVDAARSD